MSDPAASPSLGRLSFLLALFSLVTIGVGLWLGWTSAIVLPRQDPSSAAAWLAVAGGLIGYSGLCSALLRAPTGASGLRWLVIAASLVAMGLGIHGIREALAGANSGREFAGFVPLIGCVVVAHAACALAYAWVRRGEVAEETSN